MALPSQINIGSDIVQRADLASLTEEEIFEENVPLIEKQNHYATGGPDGISNIQAIVLGSRTKWLKAKIDAFIAGLIKVLWAEKADKLATARNIALTGDVSGSADFDGSDNINISVTLTNAYTKTEVDTLMQGLKAKASVRVATTANITLSGTQTIDGILVAAGDRVLVKNQTTGSQNGIYIASASAWVRALDADTALELTSAYVLVEQGTVNANMGFVQTADDITLNTTSLTFVKFSTFGGNADTATALQTSRTINGVPFNGTSNINIEDRAGIVASAPTTTIGNPGQGESLIVTGAETISSFGNASVGTRRTLIFFGSLTIVHANGFIYLPTGANITTAAMDTADFVRIDDGWLCVGYMRANGTALDGGVEFATQAEVDAGTITDKAVSPATLASKTSGMFVLDGTVLHITA